MLKGSGELNRDVLQTSRRHNQNTLRIAAGSYCFPGVADNFAHQHRANPFKFPLHTYSPASHKNSSTPCIRCCHLHRALHPQISELAATSSNIILNSGPGAGDAMCQIMLIGHAVRSRQLSFAVCGHGLRVDPCFGAPLPCSPTPKADFHQCSWSHCPLHVLLCRTTRHCDCHGAAAVLVPL